MRRLAQSLRFRLSAPFLLISSILVGISGWSMWQDWAQHVTAKRTAEISTATRMLFEAMKNFRVERGTASTWVLSPTPVHAQAWSDIEALRDKSNGFFAAALHELDPIPDYRGQIKQLATDFESVLHLRQEVDAALTLPVERRDPSLAARWIKSVGSFVASMDELSTNLSREIRLTDPAIYQLLTVQQLGWTVRDFAGRDRLYVANAIASRQPLTHDWHRDVAHFRGRIDGGWLALREAIQSRSTPSELLKAMALAQASYFNALVPERDRLQQLLQAQRDPELKGEDFIALSNPGLESLMAIPSLAAELAEGYAKERMSLIQAEFATSAALAVFGALAATFAFWFVKRCAVDPLSDLTRSMTQLAQGSTATGVPHTRRKDELGGMARAVAIFRQNALDLLGRTRALEASEARLAAAMENMSQGLCMFDKDERLIVCNGVYKSLYRLPDDLCRPGTSLVDIFQHRLSLGFYAPDVTLASMLAANRARNARAAANVSHVDLQDGRTIAIAHKPMPCGGYVATHQDVTDEKRAEARIAHMARHDALTNLPNRVLFREHMDTALEAVRAHRRPFALLCLDLDNFKQVNDTLGHPIGDALLKAVAARLQSSVHERDVIARLGGDEFAIIQFDSGAKEASALAQRIVAGVASSLEIEGHQLVVGTSVGIAIAPDDGLDADQLLKNADMALYKAKADARGTFRFFEPEMDAEAQRRRILEIELRSALHNGEFELLYQPFFAVKTRAVEGFEALVRWRHPGRGMISPSEFIPVAEDTGLIGPLGEWVLREACREAATWGSDIKLAVNISSVQFRTKNLLQTVVSALASSGLAASRLELEITESVLLQDTDNTLATLKQLRELGVGIAMDDFGTGYSSLSYLQRFPVTKIKIDRSFISSIGHRKGGSAVVRAVVEIARSLRMTATAEGVETERQLVKLAALGCDQAQGYLVSPPVSAARARELLPGLRHVA